MNSFHLLTKTKSISMSEKLCDLAKGVIQGEESSETPPNNQTKQGTADSAQLKYMQTSCFSAVLNQYVICDQKGLGGMYKDFSIPL